MKNKYTLKILFAFLFCIIFSAKIFSLSPSNDSITPEDLAPDSKSEDSPSVNDEPKLLSFKQEIEILVKAYPDIIFSFEWDSTKADWKITMQIPTTPNQENPEYKESILYWQEGRFITEAQIPAKETFRRLLFAFPTDTIDPTSFSDKDKEEIKKFTAPDARLSAPVTCSSFFDAIYNSSTKIGVEQHLTKVTFLGRKFKVHERIAKPLEAIDKEINDLAKETSDEGVRVATFLKTLNRVECYCWRQVRDSQGRSMHSMAIAVDILPTGNSKAIYWNWERSAGNEEWYLVPLSKRWLPPQEVIGIFEKYGFCWGGKWVVWDNMHFEYRPEILTARSYYFK